MLPIGYNNSWKKKCLLFREEVTYFGHLVQKQGIQYDSDKTKVYENWPGPGNKRDVKYFLGFVGYYGRCIENFSEIVKPLRPRLGDDHLISNNGIQYKKVIRDYFTKQKKAFAI